MKLTEKDKQFLETLQSLMHSRDLSVQVRTAAPRYMVLRGTYGEKVHQAFGMTRQGVRWRFHRLFNDVYVSAFETILSIEKAFGSSLRPHAIALSKERFWRRQMACGQGFVPADRLDNQSVAGAPSATAVEGAGGVKVRGRQHED